LAAHKVAKDEKRHFNGMVIYTFSNIWKERNMRIFTNTSESVLQVASRIRYDIIQRKRANIERE
jgi:hypothetical protein